MEFENIDNEFIRQPPTFFCLPLLAGFRLFSVLCIIQSLVFLNAGIADIFGYISSILMVIWLAKDNKFTRKLLYLAVCIRYYFFIFVIIASTFLILYGMVIGSQYGFPIAFYTSVMVILPCGVLVGIFAYVKRKCKYLF